MKIAVMGKGGAGKTTISGILARSLAREGWEVVAIDCDSNPNLGISVGLGIDRTRALSAIRQALLAGTVEHAPTAEEAIDRFGTTGPDRVRVAVVTKIDKPVVGCQCCGVSPEQLLGELEADKRAVIADLEAGMVNVSTMSEGSVDIALLITEPSPKSIGVASSIATVLAERRIAGRVIVLANKVRDAADIERVASELHADPSLAGVEVIGVPEDLAVLAADARGISPLDGAPDSPALRVIADVARNLAGTHSFEAIKA